MPTKRYTRENDHPGCIVCQRETINIKQMQRYINSFLGKRKAKLPSVFIFSVLMLLFISCGSTKNTDESEKYTELQELVDSREFQIEHQWARPMSGGNINLIGNPNYIRFENDSVDVFLPYFGVRHSGAGYNREGGIKYEGLAENLKIIEQKNRNRIALYFEGEQGNENLDFSVTIYANGNVQTSVTSSQRQTISYQGEIRKNFKEQQKK